MNFTISETQADVLDVVRTFTERELAPYIEAIEAQDHLPGDGAFFKKAGDAGLIGLSFAEIGRAHV